MKKLIAAATMMFVLGATACSVTHPRQKIHQHHQHQRRTHVVPNSKNSPASTSPYVAAANCVKSNDGSGGGYDFYKLVNATSTAPCYAHWNITLGPGCQYFLDSAGPYAAPSNIWNIVRWGTGNGTTVAYLQDQHFLFFSCIINLRSEPQTRLNTVDWS
jgi:hypothetical protein